MYVNLAAIGHFDWHNVTVDSETINILLLPFQKFRVRRSYKKISFIAHSLMRILMHTSRVRKDEPPQSIAIRACPTIDALQPRAVEPGEMHDLLCIIQVQAFKV
jgi:hypothetical protein